MLHCATPQNGAAAARSLTLIAILLPILIGCSEDPPTSIPVLPDRVAMPSSIAEVLDSAEPLTPRTEFKGEVAVHIRNRLSDREVTVANLDDASRLKSVEITLPPRTKFPWQEYAAPVLLTVADGDPSGAFVHVLAEDCVERRYAPGDALVGDERTIHTAYNPSDTEETVLVATFLGAPAQGSLAVPAEGPDPEACPIPSDETKGTEALALEAASHASGDVQTATSDLGFGSTGGDGAVVSEQLTPRSEFTDDVSVQLRYRLGDPETEVANLHDASHIVVARLRLQPGAALPWHTHTGRALLSVVEGSLSHVLAETCEEREYATGEALIGGGRDRVQTAYNPGDTETVVYATFLGAPRFGPVVELLRDESRLEELDAACGLDIPRPHDPLPGESLASGQILHLEGALLGLHPDAGIDPVQVEFEWIDPSDHPDFPASDERLSSVERFIQITAIDTHEDWVEAPAGKTFFVAIPAPDGVEEERLQPLQYMYGDFVDFHGGVGSGDAPDGWAPRVGIYDPYHRLYFLPLAAIGGTDYPTRIALTEHEEAQSHDEANVVDGLVRHHFEDLQLTRRGPQLSVDIHDFLDGLTLHPFLDPTAEHTIAVRVRCLLSNCDGPPRIWVEEALEEAVPVYLGLNHTPGPRLVETFLSQFYPNVSIYYYHLLGGAQDDTCSTQPGFYRGLEQMAVTCAAAAGLAWRVDMTGEEFVPLVTAHEFFHAMQFGYGHDSNDPVVTEGTARLTEDVHALTEITGIEDPQQVNLRLGVPSTHAAETFFYNLLRATDLDFDHLGDLFVRGLHLEHLDDFVRDETHFGGLADAYWDWAKNQFFEHRGDLGPEEASELCAPNLEAGSLRSEGPFHRGDPPLEVTYNPRGLESAPLRVTLEAEDEADYAVDLEVTAGSGSIRSKFYWEEEAGSLDCRDRPDGRQLQVEVPAGQSRDIYVFVANGHPRDRRSFTLRVVDAAAPSVSITDPEDGASFLPGGETDVGNGHEITFTGTATNAQDGTLTGESLRWYMRELGSSTWEEIGTGETTTVHFPFSCQLIRDFEIRLEAKDSMGLFNSDEITIEVWSPVC